MTHIFKMVKGLTWTSGDGLILCGTSGLKLHKDREVTGKQSSVPTGLFSVEGLKGGRG